MKFASWGWGTVSLRLLSAVDLVLVAESESGAELGQKLLGWQSKL